MRLPFRPAHLLLIGCCFIALFFATGCASTGESTISQPLAAKLSQFKSARVEVKSVVPNPPEKLGDFLEQLQVQIIVKLREQKAFEKIYSQAETDSHADLRITVVITRIRDVDNVSRVMWGAFAGQARTEARVEFTDSATGKLIGSGDIVGKSSNGTVFSGTTTEAVDRVADEVAKLVEQNL